MKNFPPMARGNVALIKAVPKDPLGNVVTPDTITANIQYESLEGGRLSTTRSMTLSGGVWTATWDSSASDIGLGDVNVSLQAVNPPAASDFTFLLTANPANPPRPA